MDTAGVVIAAVLAVAGAGLLYARSRLASRLDRLATARPCRPGEAASSAAGTLVHVSASAQPGPAGPLTAPLSDREVVWHRVLVTEEYETTERDAQGVTRTERKTRTVSDDCSTTSFFLGEGDDRLEVVPADRQGVRHVPQLADERDVRGGLRIGAVQLGGGNRQRVQEWGVAVGTPLHAVGELSTGSDGVSRLDANADRRLWVSLRDPETETVKTRRNRMLVTGAAVLCGVLAVVSLVVAFTA